MNKEMNELKKAEMDLRRTEAQEALAPIVEKTLDVAGKAYNRLPETPKTMAVSVAAGALIGNLIPIPGVGAGIGALIGGAVGLWRIKSK